MIISRTLSAASLFFFALTAMGQPVLLPSIGLSALPADNDAVCTIPNQVPPIESNGYFAGDTAADFTLYDLNGMVFDLEQELTSGKPVLMIGGSYTCPVFRNKLSSIHSVAATFASQVTTIIVYTVEAHPDQDISPYFGSVNTGQQNIQAGILYLQPTTYGERKAVVDEMLDSLGISVPIYIDGPCNEWWDHYGPAPNNAYLIGTDGIIHAKHGWYDRFPDDIICDIDSLLGNPVSCSSSFQGQFQFAMTTADTVFGTAGNTLTASAKIWNTTSSDALVEMRRVQNNMPGSWTSSLCLDVCYATTVDLAQVVIPAGDTLDFHYYFYTDNLPAMGSVRIRFRNLSFPNNVSIVNLVGISSAPTYVEGLQLDEHELIAVPNPSSGLFTLSINAGQQVDVFDLQGRHVRSGVGPLIDLYDQPKGTYQAVVNTAAGTKKLLLVISK